MPRAHICDVARTPIGRYGGALAGVRADDLAANPIRALVDRHTGMSGARLAGTAAIELKLRGGQHALVTMCIGVGQGIAVLLEAP